MPTNDLDTTTANQLKEISNYYKERYSNPEITIVSGTSSICTPCSISNANRKAFPEIIMDMLINEGLEVTPINLSSVLVSMSWYLERILKHNLSIANIKATQTISVDYARSGLMGKLFMRESLRNYRAYALKKEDYNVNVTDYLKEANEILFFLSCGINDLFYRLYNDPISAAMSGDKERNMETLRRIKDGRILNQVIGDIARNIDNILTINDKTDLFCLGIYPAPFLKFLSVFSKTYKGFNDIVSEYNEKMKGIAKSYGATFIDISFLTKYCAKFGVDFHSTQRGHNLLSELLIKAVHAKKVEGCSSERTAELVESFSIDNLGLLGMIEDSCKDYEKEERLYKVTDNALTKQETKHNMNQHNMYYGIFTDAERASYQKQLKI